LTTQKYTDYKPYTLIINTLKIYMLYNIFSYTFQQTKMI